MLRFFGASGPKSAPGPLSPDSSPMWITLGNDPPDSSPSITGFLTLNHRIPHFLSQQLTEFLTLNESLLCTSRPYDSQKRRI
jgi:hypothetical protein